MDHRGWATYSCRLFQSGLSRPAISNFEELEIEGARSGFVTEGARRSSGAQQAVEALGIELQRALVGGEGFRRLVLLHQKVAQ